MILENHQYHAASHTGALSASRLTQHCKKRDKHNSVHLVTFYLVLKKYSCNSGFFLCMDQLVLKMTVKVAKIDC